MPQDNWDEGKSICSEFYVINVGCYGKILAAAASRGFSKLAISVLTPGVEYGRPIVNSGVATVKRSLERQGQLATCAMIVVRNEDNSLQVLSGNHRLKAMQML